MPHASSVERRQSDVHAALLERRVQDVENDGTETKSLLAKHVQECAAMQKKGLIIGCLILGWIVAHSPEAGKVFAFMIKIAP